MWGWIEVLRLSHIVVPWLVVARRLRRGRKWLLEEPQADVPAETPAPVAKEPTSDHQVHKRGKKRRKGKGKSKAVESAAAAPPPAPAPVVANAGHHTLYCSSCRAPVPLADHPFPCPYCNVEIVPPSGVALAYRRILWAKRALERAERAWKRAVLWNGPVWVVLFGLVIVAWSGIYTYLVIDASVQRATQPWTKFDRLVLMASAPSGIFGWWTGVMLAVHADSLGRIAAKLPRASFAALPPAQIACSHCGADAKFAEGRFTTVCVYCGAEEIRPALAERASKEAQSTKKAAQISMIDAYRAIVKRREALLTYVDIMALCVVALLAIEVLRWIPFVDKIFAFFE